MGGGGLGVRIRRAWRSLRSKPVAVQVGALVVVLAVIGGAVVAAISLAPSSGSSSSSSSASGGGPQTAAASRDGVTKDSVTIVAPVIDLNAAAGKVGLQGQTDEKDEDGITAYVDAINANGGINGRKLVARVEKFNPLDQADMRAKCKDWTSSGNVFTVVDTGKWYDAQQLCITQEGKTPLISDWTTVTDWTRRGAPYLWWTGPDQSTVVENLVPWGLEKGLLGGGRKFGIVVGDRAGDKLAVDRYLTPALRKNGVEPVSIETVTASIEDPATAQSQAKVAVQRLKAEGAETVIPLLPANAFFSYLSAAHDQQFGPKLMLSDYESNVQVALSVAEFQFPDLLGEQLGTTFYTLSSEDDDRPGIGYQPGALNCFNTWKQNHPVPPYLEAQGPTMRWCQNLDLFATAARNAGPDLNRRTFVEALAALTNYQGALVPTLSYGPNRFAGPNQIRTVRIHKNDEANNQCPLKPDGGTHGSCWLLVDDFEQVAG